MTLAFDETTRQRIMQRCAAFPRAVPPAFEPALKQAAVAFVLVAGDVPGEAAFVLTLRAASLRAHSSQWALPGGRLDGAETAIEAALRELEEEISLRVPASDVLGRLDDYPTRSGYLISPVVVWAEDVAAMKPNPGEVASIHSFALSELEREDSPLFLTIPESERPVIRLLLGDGHVHAPTAAVLYQFAEVALRGRATRVTDLEQPVWAWK